MDIIVWRRTSNGKRRHSTQQNITKAKWPPLTTGFDAEIKGHLLICSGLQLGLFLQQCLSNQMQGLGERAHTTWSLQVSQCKDTQRQRKKPGGSELASGHLPSGPWPRSTAWSGPWRPSAALASGCGQRCHSWADAPRWRRPGRRPAAREAVGLGGEKHAGPPKWPKFSFKTGFWSNSNLGLSSYSG